MEFKINLDDKPHLKSALINDKEKAKEVIATFVDCMEEAFKNKGIKWADLAKELHHDLTFKDLILGILKGVLDVKDISPEAYDILKVEIHPLSILGSRKSYFANEIIQRNWRAHFRQPEDAKVDEATIARIMRTIMRYNKYVSIQQLAEAIDTKQEMTFRGLSHRVIEMLPMRPALEYQRNHISELHVGTFDLDTGGLDCGEIDFTDHCPACKKKDVAIIESNMICFTCNASYKINRKEQKHVT